MNFKKYRRLSEKGWIGFDEIEDIKKLSELGEFFNLTVDGDAEKIILCNVSKKSKALKGGRLVVEFDEEVAEKEALEILFYLGEMGHAGRVKISRV